MELSSSDSSSYYIQVFLQFTRSRFYSSSSYSSVFLQCISQFIISSSLCAYLAIVYSSASSRFSSSDTSSRSNRSIHCITLVYRISNSSSLVVVSVQPLIVVPVQPLIVVPVKQHRYLVIIQFTTSLVFWFLGYTSCVNFAGGPKRVQGLGYLQDVSARTDCLGPCHKFFNLISHCFSLCQCFILFLTPVHNCRLLVLEVYIVPLLYIAGYWCPKPFYFSGFTDIQ